MSGRRVIVANEPFGAGFDVTISPSFPDEPLDREFQTYADAAGYAKQLAGERDWSVVDRSSEAQL